jgi:hypothetical protein
MQKLWSELTPREKTAIGRRVDAMRAVHATQDSVDAALAGQYDVAIKLAGESRMLVRRLASNVRKQAAVR